MDFDEVVLKRRSIRKFREDPVSERVLLKILEAGRWAPSAGNCQPWRFIVVTDVEVKKRIAVMCTESSRKAWAEFPPERARYLAARGGSWDKSGMANIPVLIAVCCELVKGMRKELVLGSVWATIENILLAATAEGLGSCIYTFYDIEEENDLKKILEVPSGFRVAAMVQLGFAVVDPPLPSKKTLKELVSFQRF